VKPGSGAATAPVLRQELPVEELVGPARGQEVRRLGGVDAVGVEPRGELLEGGLLPRRGNLPRVKDADALQMPEPAPP
jgi:hypothetical protein